MKTTGFFLTIIGLALIGFIAGSLVYGSYKYEQKYLYHWELADKSSTIEAKQKHIEKFVDSLETGKNNKDFTAYGGLFLQTPSNSFRENMNALNTLNQRLNEIKEMNPSSFEYNTAIQQITAQEQGEASSMLDVFQTCYMLANYPYTHVLFGVIIAVIGFFMTVIGATIFTEY